VTNFSMENKAESKWSRKLKGFSELARNIRRKPTMPKATMLATSKTQRLDWDVVNSVLFQKPRLPYRIPRMPLTEV